MKVLIANRGEIAVRLIRGCHELGLAAVAVYSECDRDALHVRLADEAFPIGPSPAAESYLRVETLVDVARGCNAALVHPGYGFLAENAAFAQACQDAGLTFIGPSPGAIRRMGSKTAARELALAAGVPVVPGSGRAFNEDTPLDVIDDEASRIGFPLLVKAVAGGGGKGMRTVTHPVDLPAAVRLARSEARSAFGDGAVYLERRIAAPRHIEIQVLADGAGTVVPFVERECSIQRRHQKVVEESPSLAVTPEIRRELAAAAIRIVTAARYTNAGTLEFLLDEAGHFYFLEMNTRLQVEHPVTEAVTGIDLVHWQIRLACGEPLTISPQAALTPRAHAIECRIYAEDPDAGFLPSPGVVRALRTPAGPGVRDDRGFAAGYEVPLFYDSLLAKLITWGATRDDAIARMARALDEYRISGVKTTIPFFRWLIAQPAFLSAAFSTTYLDDVLADRVEPFVAAAEADREDAALAAALAAWLKSRRRDGPRSPDAASGGAWRRAARLDGVQ
jgi:acetyl-CoA carboxylase biotin carboxylase subunit